jgi:uncharacterized protein involved in exopolysaccharide biosynthesis
MASRGASYGLTPSCDENSYTFPLYFPSILIGDSGFEANDPALSAKIANTLSRSYIDLNLETKLKATQDAMVWLNSRIEDEQKKVDHAEQVLLRYKEKHNETFEFSKIRI